MRIRLVLLKEDRYDPQPMSRLERTPESSENIHWAQFIFDEVVRRDYFKKLSETFCDKPMIGFIPEQVMEKPAR